MEQLAATLKEIKSYAQSYAQITISGDLFSRLLAAASDTRQDMVNLERTLLQTRVKLQNLESIHQDWDRKAEMTEHHMADWANQVTHGISCVQAQVLQEQEITAKWMGHLQREREKNSFLENSIKLRNEEYTNLKVEYAALSERTRKLKGEKEILEEVYQKATKNQALAFQKK